MGLLLADPRPALKWTKEFHDWIARRVRPRHGASGSGFTPLPSVGPYRGALRRPFATRSTRKRSPSTGRVGVDRSTRRGGPFTSRTRRKGTPQRNAILLLDSLGLVRYQKARFSPSDLLLVAGRAFSP